MNSNKQTPERVNGFNHKEFKDGLEAFVQGNLYSRPIKIEVTYDSYRHVKEYLEEIGVFDKFWTVVDEFQMIMGDSPFKPETELEFIQCLQDVQKLAYVSATPMIEDALDELDEFKDLPYWELDWESEDPTRVIVPDIQAFPAKSINGIIKKYVTDHKSGNYSLKTLLDPSTAQPIKTVEAKELCFYINSVKNICDAIRQNKLMPEEVNIICADTADNRKKLREAFRVVFKDSGRDTKELPSLEQVIGKVPLYGQPRKPYTFLTKTAYLGADMYSDCARTIILSDSGADCMMVDITLDLPQIIGRQRDDSNPWKYSAEVWFKAGCGKDDITPEQLQRIIDDKLKITRDLLNIWSKGTISEQNALSAEYEKTAKRENYKDHYVAVNKHVGSNPVPCVNKLVLVSEKRSNKIRQLDYKDRFSVFNTIESTFNMSLEISEQIQDFLSYFNENVSFFTDRMKYLCEYLQDYTDLTGLILKQVPTEYSTFYYSLGPDIIKSLSYQRSKLLSAIKDVLNVGGDIATESKLQGKVYQEFKEGNRLLKSQIKERLRLIYLDLGISKTPKATDLEQWFILKRCGISINGKQKEGFEITKRK